MALLSHVSKFHINQTIFSIFKLQIENTVDFSSYKFILKAHVILEFFQMIKKLIIFIVGIDEFFIQCPFIL